MLASDCYTLWNFRKIVIAALENTTADKQKFYATEFNFLEGLLQHHPKSYWIWFHRMWLTLKIENMDWNRELMLCTKALEMDKRNFHCWNYRRFVTVQAKISTKDEFAFTTMKVEQDFSNYSSWHHRSYLLQKIFEESPGEIVKIITEEFELVRNAFYTLPDDQSAWFYHRWLVGMTKKYNREKFTKIVEEELNSVEELLEEEPNSKWATLTTVFLLNELGRGGEAKDKIAKLQLLDPLRKNCYGDLQTKN